MAMGVLQLSRRRIQGDEDLITIPGVSGEEFGSSGPHFDGDLRWWIAGCGREGNVGLALRCLNLGSAEMAAVHLQLVDARSRPPLAHKTIYSGVAYPGRPCFLQLPPVARLKALGLIYQDQLSFTFSGHRLRQAPWNQSNLSVDFGRLLQSGEGSDVTFQVGEEEFPAHQAVVDARSPTLATEMHKFELEGTSDVQVRVQIEGDIQPKIFGGLLKFLYTDQLPRLEEIVGSGATKQQGLLMNQSLFILAERFQLDRMKELLEEKMFVDLDVNISAATLAFAQEHGRLKLQENCCRAIVCNGWLQDVIESEAFSLLKNRDSYPVAAIDSLLLEAGRALKRPRNSDEQRT